MCRSQRLGSGGLLPSLLSLGGSCRPQDAPFCPGNLPCAKARPRPAGHRLSLPWRWEWGGGPDGRLCISVQATSERPGCQSSPRGQHMHGPVSPSKPVPQWGWAFVSHRMYGESGHWGVQPAWPGTGVCLTATLPSPRYLKILCLGFLFSINWRS